jgi:hypothetical protein
MGVQRPAHLEGERAKVVGGSGVLAVVDDLKIVGSGFHVGSGFAVIAVERFGAVLPRQIGRAR